MFGRFLQPLPLGVRPRAYSIFSSKPGGGGRYYNSAKPHKVAPTTAAPSTSTKDSTTTSSSSPTSETATATTATTSTTTTDNSQEEALVGKEQVPVPVAPAVLAVSAPTPRLPPHPTFSVHTYPLHQFFAFHRPLLHLSQPTSAIFDSPKQAFEEPPPPLHQEAASAFTAGEAAEASADADADAARQLARALAVNRLGGWIDWEETLATLGDPDSKHAVQVPISSLGVYMDSTKRKRRRKMSKHKFKKRRRLQRSARQKMGK